MQGFFLSFKKFLQLGRNTSRLRPSLSEFAITYTPDADEQVKAGWKTLQTMLGRDYLDAGLNGLLAFVRANQNEARARVCFSADCEVGFEIVAGQLCIDPHEQEPVCCSPQGMMRAIEEMLETFDAQYA